MTSEQVPSTIEVRETSRSVRRVRAGHRSYATKLLANIDEKLSRQKIDSTEILMLKLSLEETASTLKSLDKEILRLLEDDSEVENEVFETNDLQSQILLRTIKADKALAPAKESAEMQNSRPITKSEISCAQFVKMPRLEIAKFTGDPKDYTRFRNSFDAAIHKSSLSPIQKFTYLKSYVKGDAERTIRGLALTDANYEAALDLLEQRFGNRQSIVNSHMDSLLKINNVQLEDDTRGIRELYDQVHTNIRSLEALGVGSDNYGALLVPIIISKLPKELNLIISRKFDSRRDNWELADVLDALRGELEARERCASVSNLSRKPLFTQPESAEALLAVAGNKLNCPFCSGEHYADACKNVTDLATRMRILQNQGRCFKCLNAGHIAKSCNSRKTCIKCKKGHHTAICQMHGYQTRFKTENSKRENGLKIEKEVTRKEKSNSATNPPQVSGTLTTVSTSTKQDDLLVLLETATVYASSPEASKPNVKCRVLFDGGCQKTYITNELRSKLQLKPIRTEMIGMNTFGGKTIRPSPHEVVQLSLQCRSGGQNVSLEAVVIQKICSTVRIEEIDSIAERCEHLVGLRLADSYYDLPADEEISILVGLNYYWKIVDGAVIRGQNSDQPVALASKFGFILSGPTCVYSTTRREDKPSESLITHSFLAPNSNENLTQAVHRFWEIEQLGLEDSKSTENSLMSKVTHDGKRYVVPLPWQEDHPLLPDNYAHARKRFFTLLTRLQKDSNLLAKYDNIMREQLQQEIIEEVNDTETVEVGKVYYMPHTCVIREDKATSKVRVVFDASAKTDGVSLNDCLHSGPSWYSDLFAILLRFRCHRIGIVADLEKAFLNVAVQKKDQDVLRFIWTDEPHQEHPKLKVFRFKRVCFGVSSSPFLLAAVIKTHLDANSAELPALSYEFENSTYVDNYCGGADNVRDGKQFHADSKRLFKEAGMNLRQWSTNNQELQASFGEASNHHESSPKEPTFAETNLNPTLTSENKVLGLIWDKDSDALKVDLSRLVSGNLETLSITKRSILSVSSSIYDPLGFLSPLVVKLKVLFQKVCKEGGNWDDPLRADFIDTFKLWCHDLRKSPVLSIPRRYFMADGEIRSLSIVGFSDASDDACAAVVYVRAEVEGQTAASVALACSKTRVNPIQKLTTPRAELCGAMILSKLVNRVKSVLITFRNVDNVVCLTDSSIVFWWIQRRNTQYNRFVQHRLQVSRENVPPESWYHVPGEHNIADLPSRGCNMSELDKRKDWTAGPDWLQLPRELWPVSRDVGVDGSESELLSTTRRNEITMVAIKQASDLEEIIAAERYSDYDRLITVTAWVLRFVRNAKQRISEAKLAPSQEDKEKHRNNELRKDSRADHDIQLDATEFAAAEALWFKHLQIKVKGETNYKEMQRSLGLYNGDDGVIRCAGRLRKSQLSFETKYPVILPRSHHFTKLLIQRAHEAVFHNGVKETLTELRSRFWVVKGRQKVKQIIRSCVLCKRLEGQPYPDPTQAALPEFRVTASRAFQTTGLDYFGPIYVQSSRSRNAKMVKAYVELFSCASSRMVHLELTRDLGAQSCIWGFKRFMARRGVPERVISDNAQTFRSAQVKWFATKHHIKWQYNLPRAPWWGGMFERLVRSTKRCLRKSLRSARITYEEMNTVLCEIEAVLNSRPLTYIYEDDVEQPLTPSHLCYGKRYLSCANHPEETIDYNHLMDHEEATERAQNCDDTLNHFWRRWEREYLISLREHHRQKYRGEIQIAEGDVVIVKDDNTKRNQWRLAVIEQLIKGDDKKTRGAIVRLSRKGMHATKLTRPIQCLIPLEIAKATQTKDDHETQKMQESSLQNDDDRTDEDSPTDDVDDENISSDALATEDDEEEDRGSVLQNRPTTRPRRAAALDGEFVRRTVMNLTRE